MAREHDDSCEVLSESTVYTWSTDMTQHTNVCPVLGTVISTSQGTGLHQPLQQQIQSAQYPCQYY